MKKGFSIVISGNRVFAFYLKKDKHSIRICLGYVIIIINRFNFETFLCAIDVVIKKEKQEAITEYNKEIYRKKKTRRKKNKK